MSISHVVELNESSLPPSPIPDLVEKAQVKRQRVDISEEQVKQIVDILGLMLLKIKNEIMDIKDKYAPTAAVNFLLRRMSSSDTILINDVYCLMTGFMTVYLVFIELLLQDLSNNSNSIALEDFMQLFSENDTLFGNNNPFLWYYLYARTHTTILSDLHQQLKVHFSSLSHIDSIFSRFYTIYFLGEESNITKKHQKDHGQYYTPYSVIHFMWGRCLPSNASLLHNNGAIPRVFDPCLGIGSFLCEFLSRLVSACRFTPSIWDNPKRLYSILTKEIPESVYGIEIDPFAFQLCKINMLIHLFPFYQRLVELNVELKEPNIIQRIRLFCNDTLKLDQASNAFTNEIDPFESACLSLLRDANQLKFHYIVTNPPYMIRKTGFITQPDPQLYNEQVLGGRGTQAYLYFMWICLQRCDDDLGQVCLITPSQWTVLEFAEHLRSWIWTNCKLLEMYEFEPYKVWPKVQTDSLIFRVCKRNCLLPRIDKTIYLRHTSRRIPLKELLACYENFKSSDKVHPEIMFKETVFSNESAFSTILPTTSVLDKLIALTDHFPRICDGEKSNSNSDSPLVWNRGPNTNPVYSLVVRTEWALQTFGFKACSRWLRPCFYWNGKSSSSGSGGGKEGAFWHHRDLLRLQKKEFSAAEAYWPFCNLTKSKVSYYSMIMVNKEDAETLKREYHQLGEDSESASLYHYLQEARIALQPNKTADELAYCQYNKSGAEYAIKLVHPINCGYFTRSQPRQRFFLDKSRMAVTNQCIYFTIKPESKIQDADFFLGLLNCSLYQFFIKSTCYYDQQGRMRFFGRLMANIPYMNVVEDVDSCCISRFTQGITLCRTWLYAILRLASNTKPLMERIRNNEYELSKSELESLEQIKPDALEPDSSLQMTVDDTGYFNWINDFVFSKPYPIVFPLLLKITHHFQFAIDQLVYCLYKVPLDLQLGIEDELNLKNNRIANWPQLENDAHAWSQDIIDYAKKLTLISNENLIVP